MRLHESYDEGGFGVPNNTISRHATAYTTNARFVAFLGTFARPAQEVWLQGNNIQDPTTWIVPALRTLKSTCTKLFCKTTTARSSLLQTRPHSHQLQAAARLQTPGRHLHRRQLATKMPVRAPLSFRSSTDSMRHTSGGRMLFWCLLLPRTCSLLCLAPSHRNSVSRSSSLNTGLNSRPCVRGTLARCSRSIACCTCLRSTKPLPRLLLFVWK